MTESAKSNVRIYNSKITVWWFFSRTMYIIKIGDNPLAEDTYILTFGKKMSKNFLLNMYLLIKKGTCREVKFKRYTYGLILDKDARYLWNKRVTKNFLLSHFSESLKKG